MTAAALEHALAALGVPCVVEAQERLAVLRPSTDAAILADPAVRAQVVALAMHHGFTHVAVELANLATAEERTGATVSGN